MYIIAGFSGATGESSSSLSLTVTEQIVDIIDYNNGMTEEEFADMVELMHTPVRKVAHMTEYAILCILLFVPMKMTIKNKEVGRLLLIAFIICVLYAAFDEIHQLFVDGRSGRFSDVIIDSIGASFGLGVVFCINKLAHSKIVGKSK